MNTSRFVGVASLLVVLAAVFAACGGSTSTATPNAPPTDAGTTDVAQQETSTGTDADPPTDAGNLPNSDAGPITAPGNTWTWVPFGDSKCRSGNPTGIGVNVNPASTKLMIYLEGGGACFNAITCGQNLASFADAAFALWVTQRGSTGIFSRDDAANALKDWSFVYVPYCTGDVHAGNNPAGTPAGLTQSQVFVGYANVGLYLKRIVPTFPNATQVLLTGISAGGFGAAANYVQVQKAFGAIPVDMLDDSGPTMQDPYFASCLQDLVRKLWNLDATVLADCGSACTPPNFLLSSNIQLAKTYPNRKFGLMDSVNDGTISNFLGFGAQNCGGFTPIPPDTYQAGLMDIRTQLTSYPNFGTFYFPGGQHTSLVGATYDTRTAGTTKLTDWVSAFVTGTVSNVGP